MGDRDDFFNRRIEQLEFNVSQLQRFQNVLTSTQLLNTFDNNGKVAVRVGQLTSTGRYGVEVLTSTGGLKARFGKLGDGTYGVEISTGGTNLVHLTTLAFGPVGAFSTALVTTTSTSYVALSGGPSVTATIGNSGRAIVSLTALMQVRAAGVNQSARMSFNVVAGGSTTVAASDIRQVACGSTRGEGQGSIFYVTGLTSGSNTFTARYRGAVGVPTSTVVYANRHIVVFPF